MFTSLSFSIILEDSFGSQKKTFVSWCFSEVNIFFLVLTKWFRKLVQFVFVWFNGEWHQSWVSKWEEEHIAKWYKKRGDPSNRGIRLSWVTSYRSFGKRIFISIRCCLHIPVTSTISRIASKASQCAFIPSWSAHGAWFGHHLFNIGACLWSFPLHTLTPFFPKCFFFML